MNDKLMPLLFCLVALAGCGTLISREDASAPQSAAGNRTPAADVESLLAYFYHLKELTSANLNKEYALAKQEFASNPNDANRLRLALLLSLPQGTFHDDSKAIDLLEPVAKFSTLPLRHFALLLSINSAEHRRLDENIQNLNENLRDEQKRGALLEEKLDALKSLEKSLIERQTPQAKPR